MNYYFGPIWPHFASIPIIDDQCSAEIALITEERTLATHQKCAIVIICCSIRYPPVLLFGRREVYTILNSLN